MESAPVDWKISGRAVRTPTGKTVNFDFEIGESVEVDDVLVVRLDVPVNVSMSRNVFGLSKKGELLWQIESVPGISHDPKARYVGIFARPGGRVILVEFMGVNVTVDAKTGKVLGTGISK
jgi:hypothetical protein